MNVSVVSEAPRSNLLDERRMLLRLGGFDKVHGPPGIGGDGRFRSQPGPLRPSPWLPEIAGGGTGDPFPYFSIVRVFMLYTSPGDSI